MKVLLINTSDKTGGAAVAASRLMHALKGEGMEVRMLVCDKLTTDDSVVSLAEGHIGRLRRLWKKAFERLLLLPRLRFSRHNLWAIDNGACGYDVTRHPAFEWADIIHMHWVNQGMMSLNDIRRVISSGKRVVWTMHDLWSATAICHYAADCEAFTNHCQHCPLLPGGGSATDLSAKTWKQKAATYSAGDVTFVTCSEWLGRQARQSALLRDQEVVSIPNPIDTKVFCPKDKKAARRALGLPETGRIVLFVSQKVTDERKGARYFIDAINAMAKTSKDLSVAILGGNADDIAARLDVPAYPLGYVTDTEMIVNVYNSADCFCLPSLQDNLPNTIMEAMACGVPCVGFDIGGIPEMIDHGKNGYIAVPRDTQDLAHGIALCLTPEIHSAYSAACIDKVNATYSEHQVAQRFLQLYQKDE